MKNIWCKDSDLLESAHETGEVLSNRMFLGWGGGDIGYKYMGELTDPPFHHFKSQMKDPRL